MLISLCSRDIAFLWLTIEYVYLLTIEYLNDVIILTMGPVSISLYVLPYYYLPIRL